MRIYIVALVILLMVLAGCSSQKDVKLNEDSVLSLKVIENGQVQSVNKTMGKINPMDMVIVVGADKKSGIAIADDDTYVIQ